MDTRRVIVSPHAVERLRQRVTVTTRDPAGHIFFEVQDAFRDGRISKRIPRWVVDGERSRQRRADRVLRYAWNEARTCCYVLIWAAAHGDGRRSWVVVTTLAPSDQAVAA